MPVSNLRMNFKLARLLLQVQAGSNRYASVHQTGNHCRCTYLVTIAFEERGCLSVMVHCDLHCILLQGRSHPSRQVKHRLQLEQ